MYGKKVKLRFFFIILVLTTLSFTVFLIIKSLEENVIYFQSPSEIKIISERNVILFKPSKEFKKYINSNE